MGRIIDADLLREEVYSWGMNDYEPSDFIDAIDNTPTVEAIPKADYELLSASITMMKADYNARLKADMEAMLTDLSMKIGEIEDGYTEFDEENKRGLTMIPLESVERLIDREINSLKGEQNK